MLNDTFPLRVEAIPAAHASEWRADDSFPPSETQAWQLVFVRSGTIEERCDAHHVLLRAGGLLFHQPGEVFAMTTVGEVPPETLRIDFYCTGAAMDRFRGAMLHTEPAEQHDLNWLANAANELFDAAPVPGGRPVLKEELPFGAMQQFIIHLENLLILLARRCRRTKRPVARVRRERRQNALVEDARAYFAENLAHELKIDDICTALGMGEAHIKLEDGTVRRAACMGGMLSMLGGECHLLATTFEWADAIDAERAARSKARAEALLAQKNLDKRDMQLAEARLRRALVRSSVAARKDI